MLTRPNFTANLCLCLWWHAVTAFGAAEPSNPASAAPAAAAPLAAAAPAAAAPAAAPAAETDFQHTREAFIAAMQRVRQNLPEMPDSATLQAYPLHDYLVAARLRRDLVQKPAEEDAAIDAFVELHSGQPVARGIKHDWLASLARRHRWDQFLPRSADVTDPVLVCDRLAGRLATGDRQGLGPAALARWVLPLKPAPECSDIFAWLKLEGLVTPQLAETKVRAALAADNPRLALASMADVPVARSAVLLQWCDLLEAPKAAVTVLATHPSLPVEPDALGAGFEKLAHTDSAAASNLLPLLLATRHDLPPELQTRLRRAAALGAAYDHDLNAVDAFDGLPANIADGQVEEWRVRAALWSGDYQKALRWIEGMPAGLATQPRWRYWRARAVEATAGAAAAAPLFGEIAGLRDYYGYLAADRLQRSYSLNDRPSPDDATAQSVMAAQSGFVRAHELFVCDMADEAALEWSAELVGADAAAKIQAAHLAARWGWYAQSIATLAQAGEWDDVRLRYPRPYADVVFAASRLANVPADWIWGVMRQESLYRKDAVSRADARGLMQMLPSTAAAVARRWHLPSPRGDGLFEPSEAVPLGAAYLRELLDRHADQLTLSLAAYNAGTAPVAHWLPARSTDADIWIENIPYAETRAYVQHILEHLVALAWVGESKMPRLAALMPAIAPKQPVPESDRLLESL